MTDKSYFLYYGSKFPKPHSSLQVSRYGRGQVRSFLTGGNTAERYTDPMGRINSLVIGQFYSSAELRLLAGGMIHAQNSALNKLYEKMNQASDLVVAFKERGKALTQAEGILRTLIRTTRAVRRRDPRIVRAFLNKYPDKKDIIRSPSGLWLGYHFGVVPTVHDLHKALGIFANNYPVSSFSVSSGSSGGHSDWDSFGWDIDYQCTVKIGGVMRSFDPNVSLATSLGFGQPLSVAWELTPFSWVVDYFANVGDFLKNLEPRFPGFNFAGQYTTRRVYSYSAFNRYRDEVFEIVNGRAMCRTPGWPDYNLEFNSPLALNAQQCSYLAAVLGQLLTSMTKK